MSEINIVGAGVIGLCAAYTLLKRGFSVRIFDQGPAAREASWAGGGILSPIHPHHYPSALARLCQFSAELYPTLVAEIEEIAGFSAELRDCGLLRVARSVREREDLLALSRYYDAHQQPFKRLDGQAARAIAPALHPEIDEALFENQVRQVRNPRLLKALLRACEALGAELHCDEGIEDLQLGARNEVVGLLSALGSYPARESILCAGAWSGRLYQRLTGQKLPVRPVHGQMILLDAPGVLRNIIIEEGFYLIPRADGQIIVGSTLEERGFDKSLFAASTQQLLSRAIDLVPALARARFVQAWAGLRPGSPDRLPFIGRPLGIQGLILATGHYRNGLLLAPATAELLGSILSDEAPALPLDPYSPSRLELSPTSP